MAAGAVRSHHIVPLVEQGQNVRNLLRRILHVRVQRDDLLSSHMFKSGQNGHVLAEIAVQVYDFHAGIISAEAAENLQR